MRHSIMDTVSRQVALLLVFTVGRILCEPPLNNQYGVPGNYAGSNNDGNFGAVTNNYGPPLENGHDENQDYVDNQPKSYEFGYAVKDLATGNDFGRRESSDGETVRGEYRVQLPDGRTQIVTYTADWRTGFHADVRYEGEATYPDRYSNNNNGYNNNNAGSGYDFQGNGIGSGYNRGNNGYQNYQNNGGYNNPGPNNYQNNGGYNSPGPNYQNNGGYNSPGSNYNFQYSSNAPDNNYNNYGGYSGNSGNSLGSGAAPPVYGPPGYQ